MKESAAVTLPWSQARPTPVVPDSRIPIDGTFPIARRCPGERKRPEHRCGGGTAIEELIDCTVANFLELEGDTMNADVKQWESMLRGAVKRGADAFSAGVTGLAAVEHDLTSLEHLRACDLNEDPLQRRELLANKNGILHQVTSRYITSS